jgi:hypothetical protein
VGEYTHHGQDAHATEEDSFKLTLNLKSVAQQIIGRRTHHADCHISSRIDRLF